MSLNVNLQQQRLYLHYQDLQKEGALPYVQKNGEYITKYPSTGDSIRDAYDAACSSLNTPWGISDHDRHTSEIQSVSCKLIFAQDHTHEVTKNYFKKKSIFKKGDFYRQKPFPVFIENTMLDGILNKRLSQHGNARASWTASASRGCKAMRPPPRRGG